MLVIGFERKTIGVSARLIRIDCSLQLSQWHCVCAQEVEALYCKHRNHNQMIANWKMYFITMKLNPNSISLMALMALMPRIARSTHLFRRSRPFSGLIVGLSFKK